MESIAKFVCISAVAHSAFLLVYLRYDFYNTIFKIKHKLYIAPAFHPPPHRKILRTHLFS